MYAWWVGAPMMWTSSSYMYMAFSRWSVLSGGNHLSCSCSFSCCVILSL